MALTYDTQFLQFTKNSKFLSLNYAKSPFNISAMASIKMMGTTSASSKNPDLIYTGYMYVVSRME